MRNCKVADVQLSHFFTNVGTKLMGRRSLKLTGLFIFGMGIITEVFHDTGK